MKQWFIDFINKYKELDVKLFYKINGVSFRCFTLDSFMQALTQLGEGWLPMMAVMFTYANIYHNADWLRTVIYSFALAGLVCSVIKKAVKRERPSTLPNAHVVGPVITTESFPSGHTASAFALAVATALFLPQYWLVLTILAIMVGISRIYMGVHYPLDTIVGAAIGTVSAFIMYLI